MQHVNGYPAFGLAKWLEACFLLLRAKVQFSALLEFPRSAAGWLDLLLNEANIPPLDVSKDAAVALRAVLKKVIDLQSSTPEVAASEELFQEFNSAFYQFDLAFQLELGRLPVFYVTQKGVYDTRYLIVSASSVYHGYLDRLSPEVKADTDAAGRCLAFSLPTAAGFHIARATESTMLAAMAAFKCEPVPENQRSWGMYIRSLEDRGANKKVTDHLRQIKDLHRNPLLHPEQSLNLQEAMALWAICTSVIQAMVADMEQTRATPSPEIVSMLPAGDDSSS